VLAIVMVMFSVLAVVPLMLDTDVSNQQQLVVDDAIAQILVMQYQAALSVCAGTTPPSECAPGSTGDIPTSQALPADIANAPLVQSGLVVAHIDPSGRIVAFVDETQRNTNIANHALWGAVSANLIANSGGAADVGYWSAGQLWGAQGPSAYTISTTQGRHQLVEGDPMIVQPHP